MTYPVLFMVLFEDHFIPSLLLQVLLILFSYLLFTVFSTFKLSCELFFT